MGRKAGKYEKKEDNDTLKKKSVRSGSANEDMMDDEIDAFHKNRDVVPLNINEDLEESDEDNEHPVFDFEDDEDDDDDDDDDEDDDDKPPKGLAAKIARTQSYLRAKFGGVDDEILDDAEEEEPKKVVWGKKGDMHGADVDNETQSSDDEDAAAELEEVLKLQRDKSKGLQEEDFGVGDTSEDETDREPTFEEISGRGKQSSKASLDKGIKDEDEKPYVRVEKDVNDLTKEEQMDVVYSSTPELVGLLSELNDALEQLEHKVNPLVDKIRGQESEKKGGMHYMEVKQLLLQSFCQAITFYLLLKSEGLPVRDHPVVSRLVEIKSLLDKIREMDDNLPFDLEDILNKDPNRETELNTLKSSKNNELEHKHQDKQVGPQSIEMLKIRASLEEKLKQKGIFSSITPKIGRTKEHLQPLNRQLETLDDFVDEDMEVDAVANGKSNGVTNLSHSSKISQHRSNKRKFSGDDDLPKRDDIGERRRKHELRVLAGAGIKSDDYVDDETGNFSNDGGSDVDEKNDNDSDLEYYKQVEQQHAAKLAAKSNKYSIIEQKTPEVPLLPETADGKRYITSQILKNRGLTRSRKKETKNPRKNYKMKHKKAEMRRKGQVRDIRKPTGSYGGEATGINAGISRSIRFKN
ncbi:hypothetical protein ACS0TY_023378 [Phlomoides rotata]